MLDGVVKTVIADSQAQDKSSNQRHMDGSDDDRAATPLSFKAVVELNGQELKANSARFPLAAGMQLSAEIIEGKRTVLEYLLSPVQRVANEAGMER
jgi:HlyD family secretion protein